MQRPIIWYSTDRQEQPQQKATSERECVCVDVCWGGGIGPGVSVIIRYHTLTQSERNAFTQFVNKKLLKKTKKSGIKCTLKSSIE